jgi:hypothetical protein
MKTSLFAFLLAITAVACSNVVGTQEEDNDFLFSQASMENAVFTTTGNPFQPGGPRHGNTFDHQRGLNLIVSLDQNLKLSTEQRQQIAAFALTLNQTLMSIRSDVQNGSSTREQAKTKIQAARLAFITSVKTVLTDAQKAALEEWLKNHWNK